MPNHDPSSRIIRWLTYLMFMMFAMTSDSVGEIIKEVKVAFSVTNAQASLMHSLPMLGIALSGLFLGFLADKLGRKPTIIIGLALFGTDGAEKRHCQAYARMKLMEAIREPCPRARGRRSGRGTRCGVRSAPRKTRGN